MKICRICGWERCICPQVSLRDNRDREGTPHTYPVWSDQIEPYFNPVVIGEVS